MFGTRSLLAVCCLMLWATAAAQITIEMGDIPQAVGDTFVVKAARSGATVNVGNPGGPQTWTFDTSSFVGDLRVSSIIDKGSTPFGKWFPDADFVAAEPMGPFTMYIYDKLTTDDLKGLGYGLDGGSQTRVGVAVPPSILLDLPATLGTEWNSSFVNNDTLGNPWDSQDWQCRVDAWGTAVTPCGEWPCLRLSTVELYIDYTYEDGKLVSADSAWTLIYQWFARGVGAVARTQSQNGDTSANFTDAAHLRVLVRTTAGGVAETPEPAPSARPDIRPNPCVARAMLDFAPAGPLCVRLFDAGGRMVLERNCHAKSGGVPLDLSDVAPGVYLCRVTAGARTLTRRLVRM